MFSGENILNLREDWEAELSFFWMSIGNTEVEK